MVSVVVVVASFRKGQKEYFKSSPLVHDVNLPKWEEEDA